MKSPKAICWYDPVYRISLWAFVTCSEREYKDYIDSLTVTEKKKSSGGWMTRLEVDGKDVYTIWVNPKEKVKDRIIHLCHEALHITVDVLTDRGLNITPDASEAATYYQGMIVNHVATEAGWLK